MLSDGVLALALFFGAPDDNASELRALHARIAREENRGRHLRGAQRSVEQALVETERSIVVRRREAEALQREKAEAEGDKARAERGLEAVRAELDTLRRAAGRRAAAMRRLARLGPEAYWLGIEDPVRARRTEDRLRFVLEHDAALSRRIRAALAQEREQVERRAAEVRRLGVARARMEAEAAELSRLKAEREVLLEALSKERRRSRRIARLLERARAEGAQAARFVGGRSQPPPPRPGGFGAQEGLLPWPTSGRVEVTFGAKVHPAGVIVRQTGVDIRAPWGAPVRSPFAGEVVYAERRRGWGRLVIVGHPGGYFTVYGHLSELAVEVGDPVVRGRRLGSVGESDSRKGPYLYFEVREGARPLDPLDWLAR